MVMLILQYRIISTAVCRDVHFLGGGCGMYSTKYYTFELYSQGGGRGSQAMTCGWRGYACSIILNTVINGFYCMSCYMYHGVLSILYVSRVCLAFLRFIHQKQCVPSTCVLVGLILCFCHKVSSFRQPEKQNRNVIFLYRTNVWKPQWQSCWKNHNGSWKSSQTYSAW